MARAMWSGAISFGLVSIPVKMFTAVSRKSVRFNQLDSKTNSRIKQKRVNGEGNEVSYDDIVKAYEVAKDTYVTVTDDELKALAPEASRMIGITDFVHESEIDPVLYDSAYFLVPDELSKKSYSLLCKAMEADGRVAIANFVMRSKQYLVAIRPANGKLMMSTMVYHDELVEADDIPGLEDIDAMEVTEAEMTMANQLIDSLAGTFEPDKYKDNYREKVLDLLERKGAGDTATVETVEVPESAEVVDLMAALEASVKAAKEKRAKKNSGSDSEAKDENDQEPGAKSA